MNRCLLGCSYRVLLWRSSMPVAPTFRLTHQQFNPWTMKADVFSQNASTVAGETNSPPSRLHVEGPSPLQFEFFSPHFNSFHVFRHYCLKPSVNLDSTENLSKSSLQARGGINFSNVLFISPFFIFSSFIRVHISHTKTDVSLDWACSSNTGGINIPLN